MDDASADEAVAVYLRLRRVFGDRGSRLRSRTRHDDEPTGSAAPYGSGRDPHAASAVLDSLVDQLGWASPLARSELVASWPEIVGEETAARSRPEAIADGLLVVRCESTAWATQLRIMRSEILATITRRYSDAGIESIRFQGPDVPSWKRGSRSIPGRGPRDTYG